MTQKGSSLLLVALLVLPLNHAFAPGLVEAAGEATDMLGYKQVKKPDLVRKLIRNIMSYALGRLPKKEGTAPHARMADAAWTGACCTLIPSGTGNNKVITIKAGTGKNNCKQLVGKACKDTDVISALLQGYHCSEYKKEVATLQKYLALIYAGQAADKAKTAAIDAGGCTKVEEELEEEVEKPIPDTKNKNEPIQPQTKNKNETTPTEKDTQEKAQPENKETEKSKPISPCEKIIKRLDELGADDKKISLKGKEQKVYRACLRAYEACLFGMTWDDVREGKTEVTEVEDGAVFRLMLFKSLKKHLNDAYWKRAQCPSEYKPDIYEIMQCAVYEDWKKGFYTEREETWRPMLEKKRGRRYVEEIFDRAVAVCSTCGERSPPPTDTKCVY